MDFSGKTIFIGGGSRGLGFELAKLLLKAKAANIVLFARHQQGLTIAKQNLENIADKDQKIDAVPVDLSDALQVEDIFRSVHTIPDALFCVAGGATVELGYLIDRKPEHIQACINLNYYTAIFMAQAILRIWIENPPTMPCRDGKPKTRHIVFTSSAAVFVSLPGYISFTPAKCAVRAVADTLRQEVLRYSTDTVEYNIHCSFPSTFVTPSFIEEQRYKPELTKKLEGTAKTNQELTHTMPSPTEVARRILEGVRKGDFAIWHDVECGLLLSNMRGPTPKRGLGVVDSLLGFLAALIWPLIRWQQDRDCKSDRQNVAR